MKSKLSTFVPTRGFGYNFLCGGFPSLVQTVTEDTLSTALLLLSEEISIDESWRGPFWDFDCEDALEYQMMEALIKEGIVKEINIGKSLAKIPLENIVAKTTSSCCEKFLNYKQVQLSQDKVVAVRNDAKYATELLLDHGFGQVDFVMLYDCIISFVVSGALFNRLYDPLHYIDLFLKYDECYGRSGMGEKEEDVHEWVVSLTDKVIPKAPLFLTQSNYEAEVISPLERIGMKSSVPAKKGKANESSSLSQFEKVLTLRESSAARDLRDEYSRLLHFFQDKQNTQLPSFKDLGELWEIVNAEYNKKLILSKKIDRWTDVMTVPGFFLDLIAPIASPLTIVGWIASKTNKLWRNRKVRQTYPWFFFKEQLNNVKYEYISLKVSQGHGKRDKYRHQ